MARQRLVIDCDDKGHFCLLLRRPSVPKHGYIRDFSLNATSPALAYRLANSRSSMTQATVYQSLTSFSKFAKPRGRFANLTPTQAQCCCATRLTAPSCSRPPMRWSDPPLLYLQTAA